MRKKRGVRVRRKVTGSCFLPRNWMTFLRRSGNKTSEIKDKVVVSAVNENVVANEAGLEISSLMPCNMGEADERIFVHVKHASREHVHRI